MIEEFRALIPDSVLVESGAAFYSGQAAFSVPSPLYILGLNPGGSPQLQADDTVKKHTDMVLDKDNYWSEYQDESWWEGRRPGTSAAVPLVRTGFSGF